MKITKAMIKNILKTKKALYMLTEEKRKLFCFAEEIVSKYELSHKHWPQKEKIQKIYDEATKHIEKFELEYDAFFMFCVGEYGPF